jgi:hypothetical protein
MKKPLVIYRGLLYITEVGVKLTQKLLPRNGCRNAWETVVL